MSTKSKLSGPIWVPFKESSFGEIHSEDFPRLLNKMNLQKANVSYL